MAIPMDQERADRLVASLRARGVMAHLAQVGVYQCGVRIALADGGEAVWDTDGVLGLEAEVLQDGVLIGFVPHLSGSEDFTEEQIVEAIAGTEYSEDGLHPPTDDRVRPHRDSAEPRAVPVPTTVPAPVPQEQPAPAPAPADLPSASHRGRRRHWWSRQAS